MSGRSRPLARVPGLLPLADRQLGIVTREQLRALGVTRHHVRRQLDAQRWQAVGPRLVALMTGTPTWGQRLWAAHLNAGPESMLWGRTALQHLGMRGWEARVIHVGVPHGSRVPPLPGVVIHRLRTLDPGATVVEDGLRTHAGARAATEAAATEPSARVAAGLVTAVVQQRVARPEAIAAVAAAWPRMRHRTVVLTACADAATGSDSRSEAEAVRLVLRAGLPEPRRQAVVETPDGPRRVDLAVDLPDGTVLVIEIDGPHHSDPRVAAEDSRKDAAVLARGDRVLRVPSYLVHTDAVGVQRQIESIVRAARRRSGGRFAS